eukprot:Clim_evm23s33 gene=Clim_evmTU23s33
MMRAAGMYRVGAMAPRARQMALVRRGGDIGKEIPGSNLPFDVHNKVAFSIKFWTFVSVGFAVPFIAFKFQMWKKGGSD